LNKQIAALLFSAMLLAACAHPSTKATQPAATMQPAASRAAGEPSVYPNGIVAPASYAAGIRAGIYGDYSSADCCFLAGHSLLVLDNRPGARLAVFTFFVPNLKPFLKGEERVSIAFDGVPSGTFPLALGEQNVTAAIPAQVRGTRHLIASLRMSIAFVPKRIGLNGDVRELSVVLTKVGYI
jgi:hypothetical protein